MNRKLVGALLCILANYGCRACDCSCDYLPPVLDGPYATRGIRSGSTIASQGEISEIVEPFGGEAITPVPLPE
jgi:hypothetical protein